MKVQQFPLINIYRKNIAAININTRLMMSDAGAVFFSNDQREDIHTTKNISHVLK